MEVDLHRTVDEEVPSVSRRWRLGLDPELTAVAPRLVELRPLIAVVAIIVLIAVGGSSPQP